MKLRYFTNLNQIINYVNECPVYDWALMNTTEFLIGTKGTLIENRFKNTQILGWEDENQIIFSFGEEMRKIIINKKDFSILAEVLF